MRTPILAGDKRTTTVETATGAEVVVDGAPGSTLSSPAGSADAAAAYERGRADALKAHAAVRERDRLATTPVVERPRRRGSPLLSFIVAILALIGVAAIYLVVTRGSAEQGGAAVDQKLTAVTAPARHAVDNVRNTTGQAVENAGAALKSSGERIKTP